MIFRNAESSDCEALAHLHALSWRRSYQGILAQEFLDNCVEDDRRHIWRLLHAPDFEEIAPFVQAAVVRRR